MLLLFRITVMCLVLICLTFADRELEGLLPLVGGVKLCSVWQYAPVVDWMGAEVRLRSGVYRRGTRDSSQGSTSWERALGEHGVLYKVAM